ncbi:hypothetical protein ACWDU8_23290, partial [Streptomyces sp. NPDC003388]
MAPRTNDEQTDGRTARTAGPGAPPPPRTEPAPPAGTASAPRPGAASAPPPGTAPAPRPVRPGAGP